MPKTTMGFVFFAVAMSLLMSAMMAALFSGLSSDTPIGLEPSLGIVVPLLISGLFSIAAAIAK